MGLATLVAPAVLPDLVQVNAGDPSGPKYLAPEKKSYSPAALPVNTKPVLAAARDTVNSFVFPACASSLFV